MAAAAPPALTQLNGELTARVMFAGRSSSLSAQIVAGVRDALFAKKLKPGTRILSHDYEWDYTALPDAWRPVATATRLAASRAGWRTPAPPSRMTHGSPPRRALAADPVISSGTWAGRRAGHCHDADAVLWRPFGVGRLRFRPIRKAHSIAL